MAHPQLEHIRCAVFVLVLVGCGASVGSPETESPVASESPVEQATREPRAAPADAYLYVQQSIYLRDRRTVSGVRLRFALEQRELDIDAIEQLEENLRAGFADDVEFADDPQYLSVLEEALCGESGALDPSLRIGATVDVLGPQGWSETTVQHCEVELDGWTRFLTLVVEPPSRDVLLAAPHQQRRPPASFRAVDELHPCSPELWARVSPVVSELASFQQPSGGSRAEQRGCGFVDLPSDRRVVQVGVPMVATGREVDDEDWAEVPESCGRHMGCEGAAVVLVDPSQVTLLHGDEEELVHDNWAVLATFADGTDVGIVTGNYMLGQDHLVITRVRGQEHVQELLHHYESGG